MARRAGHYSIRTLIRWLVWLLAAFLVFSFLQVSLLRFINPLFTPLMAYRWFQDGRAFAHWRPLPDISPFLQQAVIASEDQKFLSHHGFDWKEIRQAIHESQEKARHRGASTISMQVAKNLYLWHKYSWVRKSLEAHYTVLIELLWSKSRIMEVYLNIAEWGPGIFGAEAAARRYFSRSADSLTRPQAALMAAVLPNPRRWSPAHPTRYIKSRQAFILRQMDQFKPFLKKNKKLFYLKKRTNHPFQIK